MKARLAKGIALPLAIFIMVVLSAMVGYLLRLFLLGNASSTQEILATRAYFAARAGIERVAYQALLPGSVGMQACPAPQTLNIEGFAVALSCQKLDYTDTSGTENISVYQMTATATQGVQNSKDYVERQIQASFSRCLFTTGGGECG